jgi:hypothetical protein
MTIRTQMSNKLDVVCSISIGPLDILMRHTTCGIERQGNEVTNSFPTVATLSRLTTKRSKSIRHLLW